MKIETTDSFNEKCDKILNYLAEISKSDNNVQILTHLNKLSSDLEISINDPVINFLVYQKKFIDMDIKTAYVGISSSGMAFISHNSFCKIQADSETQSSLNWYNQQDAKQRFDDYPIVKKQRDRSYLVIIITVLMTIISTWIAIVQYTK